MWETGCASLASWSASIAAIRAAVPESAIVEAVAVAMVDDAVAPCNVVNPDIGVAPMDGAGAFCSDVGAVSFATSWRRSRRSVPGSVDDPLLDAEEILGVAPMLFAA